MRLFLCFILPPLMKTLVSLKNIGPGLMYAGAAIGVSHLIQSTRAGAFYGLDFLSIVLIVHALKYPFFSVGYKYRIQSGENMIHAYGRLGNWAIYLLLAISFSTFSIISAAIILVSSGLLTNLLSISNPLITPFIISLFLALLLLFQDAGKITKMIKWAVIALAIFTLISGLLQIPTLQNINLPLLGNFSGENENHLLFLAAFVGWMPAPLDIVVWQSLWADNKEEKTHFKSDFKWGYWGTAFMALLFIVLGAGSFFGSGEALPTSAVSFTNELIQMYSVRIGSWSYPIMASIAFLTMLSTAITVSDAYPRLFSNSFQKLKVNTQLSNYKLWLILTLSSALLIVVFMQENMPAFIDFVTTVSFLTTPILAFVHLKILHQYCGNISKATKLFAVFAFTFMVVFALSYCYLILA